MSECEIFNGFFSYMVQFLLGLLCFLSLLYKWHYEHNKRNCKVWLMDITKQGIANLIGRNFFEDVLIYLLITFAIGLVFTPFRYYTKN